MINLTVNESALVYRYSGSTIVIAWEYHYPLILVILLFWPVPSTITITSDQYTHAC